MVEQPRRAPAATELTALDEAVSRAAAIVSAGKLESTRIQELRDRIAKRESERDDAPVT